jgi:hypothetical protein
MFSVEPIVIKKCGVVPLNVLKALGSEHVCPVAYKPEPLLESTIPTEAPATCDEATRNDFENCTHSFYSRYSFEPLILVNESVDVQEICQDVDAHQQCVDQFGVCEQSGHNIGLRYLMRQLCSSQELFKQHRKCLVDVKQSEKVRF